MRKHLTPLIIASACCLAFDAAAYVKKGTPQEYNVSRANQYLAAHLVVSPYYYTRFDGETYSIGHPVGAAIAYGATFGRFRPELEVKYLTGAKFTQTYFSAPYLITDTLKFTDVNIMFNAYYDIPILDATAVFVGLGAGYFGTKITADIVAQDPYYNRIFETERLHRDAFAYQVIFGLSQQVATNTTFDLQYRFTGTSKIENVMSICGHDFLIGARFKF